LYNTHANNIKLVFKIGGKRSLENALRSFADTLALEATPRREIVFLVQRFFNL